MERSEPGYVQVETVIVESLGAVPVERPLRWPPPPDQAATLANWMAPELLEAWEIIARDLQTPDAIVPLVLPDNWDDAEVQACAAVYWGDGSGAGISVPRNEPLAERLVHLADQFQEHEVEALWFAGRPAVWPHCPRHPNTHPLNARLHNGIAVWLCGESDVIAPIGDLH